MRSLGLAIALTLAVTVALASCQGAGDGAASVSGSCNGTATHLIGVCDAPTGEAFRALCETGNPMLVSAAERTCLAGITACTVDALSACDFHDISIVCRGDADCFAPLRCKTTLGECARCLDDRDCAPSRGCLEGLCYDTDSSFYRAMKKLQSRDAGVRD